MLAYRVQWTTDISDAKGASSNHMRTPILATRDTMNIETFYDERTFTLTYVVFDEDTRDAVVIDPVLDYDPKASKTWTESADRVIDFVDEHDLNPHYILETHAHADHLSGSQHIKKAFPDAEIGIGSHITTVQGTFKDIFDLPDEFPTDGRQFDVLVDEGDTLEAGSLEIDALYTPGHTPADVSYVIEDAVFTGDALFMPDMGTGRCDFPAGSSEDMYRSVVEKLYALPDETRVFVGHDYQPGGRELAWESTIGEEKEKNVMLPMGKTMDDFVRDRDARDSTLEAPRLLFQSVQVNVDAGNLPPAHRNKISYLRIPVNVFRPDPAEGETEQREV
jgi:glyoxylase-like metal-dependent hydrolase (beta-lactamase superfamily II)